MSTFGNKALIWWDYHTRDRATLLRFNATPKELQLQILEKWYPIGMKVGLGDGNLFNGRHNYEIIEYVQHLTYWSVRVVLKADGSLMNNMRSDRNPLGLYPSPEWEKQLKRQYKLDRLL
jgi:hypothetical protein